MTTNTSFEQFQTLAATGTFVPVCREIMADLLTPVSAFLKVAEDAEHAFLFESVTGGERLARYSFLGKDPFLVLRARPGHVSITRDGADTLDGRPFVEVLREVMDRYRSPVVEGLPRFAGGAVGFFGYEAAQWFEPSLTRRWAAHGKTGHSTPEGAPETDDASDDAVFMLFDTVLAFDHVKHRIVVIAHVPVEDGCDIQARYDLARAKIQFLERELERTLSDPGRTPGPSLVWRSNTERDEFERSVTTAQDYIRAGDIYQVVLSQRFEANVTVDPFTVYRTLRYVNPSPYMYFMKLGELAIVGSSPEMLVRVEGRHAETHPIAGTRPRGRSDSEDEQLGAELCENEKERAEHVMLVDLGRNDLGAVCEFGSVRVAQYMGLERYSHVMHLVSRVEGQLASNRDRIDALAACFPAGTVSGAPKIRAMEIIAELEPSLRGTYAGAVGYLDFAGNLDCCITIRTIAMRGHSASVQAGAGIVADSNPAAEYQETRDKASALIRALEMAETGQGPRGVA